MIFFVLVLSACPGGEVSDGYYDFLRNTGQEKVEMFVLNSLADGFADEQTLEKQEIAMKDFGEDGLLIAKAAPISPLPEIKVAARAGEPVAEAKPKFEFVCCPKGAAVCYTFFDYPCGAEC
jgi:hypothetical protein